MNKKLIIIIAVVVLLLGGFGIYYYFTNEDDKTTLTVSERQWVEDNKNKLIDFKIAKKCILIGIIGALCGSYLASKIDSQNLRKYFGIFLIIIAINGIYTFISQYKKDKSSQNNTTSKK